ncbi:MAG: hypothetical protein IJL66_03820 [Lachnospiraceae bacterium]|nr:hypothetical protein [Lachnospiraceae bacterium]
MADLLRMDLYRMRKARGFWVCLILAFVLALLSTPMEVLLEKLGSMITGAEAELPKTAELSGILREPLPFLNAMFCLLSVCGFFSADMENGYIKNIAGQVPRRGYTILSKFAAALPHGLLFMAVGIAGNLIGTVFFRKIVVDSAVPDSLRVFSLKLLLLQSICAVLLLFAGCLRIKSLGTVLAVLFGMNLLGLVYFGIDLGLSRIFPKMEFSIGDYMPDQLLGKSDPDTLTALIVSAVTIAVFLGLAVRIFDRRDIK